MDGEEPVRPYVMFDAEFPDDGVFDADENCVKPDGKSVAETLASALRSQGALVTEVLQHSFYGWQFTVDLNHHRAWFLLQGGRPWLLLGQARPTFLQRLAFKNSRASQRALLQVVNDCLARDNRFQEIRWYTKEEYERGKSRGPGQKGP